MKISDRCRIALFSAQGKDDPSDPSSKCDAYFFIIKVFSCSCSVYFPDGNTNGTTTAAPTTTATATTTTAASDGNTTAGPSSTTATSSPSSPSSSAAPRTAASQSLTFT